VGIQLAESGEIVESQQVILAAGAYGSPTILLRSGIGPDDQLRDLNIPVVANRRGEERGLKEHRFWVWFLGVDQLPGIPPARVLLTRRSAAREEGFDLHIFALFALRMRAVSKWRFR